MPTLPSRCRNLRRTAWVTLSAWLLALLAGMANACLVQPRVPGMPASLASIQAHHVEHGHDGRAEHDGPATDTGKAQCLKFCNAESSTVAKVRTAQTDMPGPVIVATVDWRSATPVATPAIWLPFEGPAPHGPPLLTRFSRLTI